MKINKKLIIGLVLVMAGAAIIDFVIIKSNIIVSLMQARDSKCNQQNGIYDLDLTTKDHIVFFASTLL